MTARLRIVRIEVSGAPTTPDASPRPKYNFREKKTNQKQLKQTGLAIKLSYATHKQDLLFKSEPFSWTRLVSLMNFSAGSKRLNFESERVLSLGFHIKKS